jgi:hypothetical protein
MDSRQVIARFEAERQALALMDHPNIAKVFDAGVTEADHRGARRSASCVLRDSAVAPSRNPQERVAPRMKRMVSAKRNDSIASRNTQPPINAS